MVPVEITTKLIEDPSDARFKVPVQLCPTQLRALSKVVRDIYASPQIINEKQVTLASPYGSTFNALIVSKELGNVELSAIRAKNKFFVFTRVLTVDLFPEAAAATDVSMTSQKELSRIACPEMPPWMTSALIEFIKLGSLNAFNTTVLANRIYAGLVKFTRDNAKNLDNDDISWNGLLISRNEMSDLELHDTASLKLFLMSHVASYKDCIVSALQPYVPTENVQMTFHLFEALQLPYLLIIELVKFSVLMWDCVGSYRRASIAAYLPSQ
jgi:hypothetical protein